MKLTRLSGIQTLRIYTQPHTFMYVIENDMLKLVDVYYGGRDNPPYYIHRRYHIGVILRFENRAALIDVGPMLYENIRGLVIDSFDHESQKHDFHPVHHDMEIDMESGCVLSTQKISKIRNMQDTEIILDARFKLEKLYPSEGIFPEFVFSAPTEYERELTVSQALERNFHKCNAECFAHHGPSEEKIKYVYDCYEVSP